MSKTKNTLFIAGCLACLAVVWAIPDEWLSVKVHADIKGPQVEANSGDTPCDCEPCFCPAESCDCKGCKCSSVAVCKVIKPATAKASAVALPYEEAVAESLRTGEPLIVMLKDGKIPSGLVAAKPTQRKHVAYYQRYHRGKSVAVMHPGADGLMHPTKNAAANCNAPKGRR